MEDIYVTRPFLPPLEEVLPSLRTIWERKVLTNGGPLHQELEEALARHLDVEHVCLFNNATVALMAAPPPAQRAGCRTCHRGRRARRCAGRVRTRRR